VPLEVVTTPTVQRTEPEIERKTCTP